MSLTLYPQKMIFDHQQKVKYVKLTNTTTKDGQPRPIMFKIKTNKIELVDAKPSCGYISGRPGHNEINVAIRWLNNANDHSAKLQILFVQNRRITEEMVERNSAHFDNDEYSQNLEAIRKENQNDVKTFLLPVNRKVKEEQKPSKEPEAKQDVSTTIPLSFPQNPNGASSINYQKVDVPSSNSKSSGISLTKCLILVILAFLIGLLTGFSIGKKQFKQAELVSHNSQVQSQEPKIIEQIVTSERVQTTQNAQNVEEQVPVETVKQKNGSGQSEDLSEFVAEYQTNKNSQSTGKDASFSESAPKQELEGIPMEETL